MKSNLEKIDDFDSSYFFDQKRDRGYTFEESDRRSRMIPDTISQLSSSKKSVYDIRVTRKQTMGKGSNLFQRQSTKKSAL